MRTSLLSAASLLVLTALVGCAETPASESADYTETTSDALIVCNDGALALRKSKANDWEHVVTVYDEGVVDWFVAQSESTVEGRSSAGGTRLVTAELPWQATVETDEDGARTLVLRELRAYADGGRYSTSGPPGSSLAWSGDGMLLSIANAFMPNSKEVVDYEVGSWFFESCAEQTAGDDDLPSGGSTGPALGGVYDGPDGSTLWLDVGQALLALPDGSEVGGTLDRDGTLGGSYTITVPEGMVCGTFSLSLWESEGVLGDGSELDARWLRPEGSVVSSCGFMLAGEGAYVRR